MDLNQLASELEWYLNQVFPGTWQVRRNIQGWGVDLVLFNEKKTRCVRKFVPDLELRRARTRPEAMEFIKEYINEMFIKLDKVTFPERVMEKLLL